MCLLKENMKGMKFILMGVAFFLTAGVLSAQTDTLFVSDNHVVHLVCPSEVTDVEVSNDEIVYVRVMENNRNIVGLMAFAPFDEVTSLMVVDASKSVYVYYLCYRREPGVLVRQASEFAPLGKRAGAVREADVAVSPSSVSSLEVPSASEDAVVFPEKKILLPMAQSADEFRKGLITHIGKVNYDVSVECDRLYVEGDKIYFRFLIKNRSSMSYSFGNVVFQVERPGSNGGSNVRKSKFQEGKTCVQQETVSVVAPGEEEYVVYVFDKFSLRRQEEFQVFFNEDIDSGTRDFELRFSPDDINNAPMRQ